MLRDLEDAETIIGGTWQLNVKPHNDNSRPPLTRIPAVANLPMEKTFWTIDKTDIPDVFLNESKEGRVVYFPWDVDRVYWEVMAHDHALLLRNAFEWAANEPAPVRVQGLGMFDITAWRQRGSITVHLVNLTNPMAMRPNIHELIPSQPQMVEVQLPAGKRASKVQTLVKEGAMPHQQIGNMLKFIVPSVLDYEVIAVDLV
jgi:hypothetical protein